MKLSPRKLKAIELLAQGDITCEECAKQVGVKRRTLYVWRQDPEFNELVLARARELLRKEIPNIFKALAKKATEGSWHHAKLLMDHLDKIAELETRQREGTIVFTWRLPSASNVIVDAQLSEGSEHEDSMSKDNDDECSNDL